jgi:hypothetical protein
MDTTVALIFSLGLALGSQDSSVSGHETIPPDPVQNTILTQRQHKVRQRIKLTNAWLKEQKLARRTQARQRLDNRLLASSTLSCTADWDIA